MASQTLIPAFVAFTLDSKTLNILDAKLSLKFDNGSGYEECMTKTGDKGYVLRKGVSVLQSGEVTITIVKTPDKKQDDTITSLQDSLKNVRQKTNPSDYAKNVAVTVQNPSAEQFLSATFSGYVSELNTQSPDLTDFPEYIAKFEVFDPTTIALSK